MKLMVVLLSTVGLFFVPSSSIFAADAGCSCSYTRTSASTGKISEVQTYLLTTYGGQTITSDAICKLACTTWADGQTVDTGLIYDIKDVEYLSEEEAKEKTEAEQSAAQKAREYLVPALNVKIPGLTFSDILDEKGYLQINFIPEYINGVYRFALGAGALIAVVMLMVGGIQYMIGSSVGSVETAKKRITNAVTGLVIMLGAYTMLALVNPALTVFEPLRVQHIAGIPVDNFFEHPDEMTSCASGSLYGQSDWQDCMLSTFGNSEAAVRSSLWTVADGQGGTYRVHKSAADSLKRVLTEIKLNKIDYDLQADSAGGTFNWRCNKANTQALSMHSWGTAIDINPSTNPYCPKKCYDGKESTECNCVGGTNCEDACLKNSYDMPEEIVAIFEENGWKWLGNKNNSDGPHDYMHFEYRANACY